MRHLAALCMLLLTGGLLVFAAAAVGGFWLFYHYGRGLPEYRQLEAYRPPVLTRLYAADGRLLSEFAEERRIFVPIAAVPPLVRQAFISAEDKSFQSHLGVDPYAIVRAALTNLRNAGSGRRPIGASTITQQVATYFFLSKEVSYERKIREAILALRLERALSKERILELYLNEIYLGGRSYGVAAAALSYFGKPLSELTLPEAAYLAAVPKAPNNYHPVRNRAAAVERRNWVISRMEEDGVITPARAAAARAAPLEVNPRPASDIGGAAFFAEEVRRQLAERYGEEALYGGGLLVRTTLEPRLQALAEESLREGLLGHDRRRGWRGPLREKVARFAWRRLADELELPEGAEGWQAARVLSASEEEGILLEDGSGQRGLVSPEDAAWAFSSRSKQSPKGGDIVLAEFLPPPPEEEPQEEGPQEGQETGEGQGGTQEGTREGTEGKSTDIRARARAPLTPLPALLRQVPLANGGLVAMDPHSGRVLAMAGGFSQAASEFNRATQALRQTGSAFKPFVYLAALEQGIPPTERILDAPFVSAQGPGLEKWKPGNYSGEYYGPTPLRIGVEKSRNLMTVRLAARLGMGKVAGVAGRFELFEEELPPYLSYALGAGETTLLAAVAAYGELVNGGRDIRPTLIEKIQDRYGSTLYRSDARDCPRCAEPEWRGLPPPVLPEARAAVTDPASAYQITSILEGVVERGTGRSAGELARPLGGKTGTTNNFVDAWFIGFSPDLVAGVYVGYDQPRSLGSRETGASAALPAWKRFMSGALEGAPPTPFRVPPEVRLRWVKAETGEAARRGEAGAILEAFRPGQRPPEAGGPAAAPDLY